MTNTISISNTKKSKNTTSKHPPYQLPTNADASLIPEFKQLLESLVEFVDSKFQNPQHQIYFTADLCRMYKVSERTILNYRKSGKLNYCIDGQKVWFTQQHIDEFNLRMDYQHNQQSLKCNMYFMPDSDPSPY